MLERAKSVIGTAAAAAMICATALTASVPVANAQPAYQDGMVQTVGWHPAKKRNWKHNNWHYYNGHYYNGHYDNDWVGPAIGFGAGVLFGSILAQPYYRYSAPRYVAPGYGYDGYPSADAYCHAKYRSYNSYTKTYTGFDGKRHYCRIP